MPKLVGYILPSYCEQSTLAMNVCLAVPGISSPVTVLTHQHEAADGLHCFALKLPSSLQSGLYNPGGATPFSAAISSYCVNFS